MRADELRAILAGDQVAMRRRIRRDRRAAYVIGGVLILVGVLTIVATVLLIGRAG
jgi:hypothetical protein